MLGLKDCLPSRLKKCLVHVPWTRNFRKWQKRAPRSQNLICVAVFCHRYRKKDSDDDALFIVAMRANLESGTHNTAYPFFYGIEWCAIFFFYRLSILSTLSNATSAATIFRIMARHAWAWASSCGEVIDRSTCNI